MITLSLLHPLNKTPVQHWSFDDSTVVRIGRSTDNDVVLYSAVVSRHHVELRKTGKGWQLVNLGTNGTYLEGERVNELPVKDGLVIRLARSGPNIQIKTEGSPQAASSIQELLALPQKHNGTDDQTAFTDLEAPFAKTRLHDDDSSQSGP